jgi:hypothetical protein
VNKVHWRYCQKAEKEHEKSQRQYAHTFHYPDTVCVCSALWELPKKHRDAILLHEIGHLIVGKDGTEAEANKAIEEVTGKKIHYVHSSYGQHLEIL